MDTQNSVVGNAGVFFESRSNESLGGTNVLGTFQISGVCLMNQQVIISKAGYSREFVTPTEVNTSHWRIDAIISKHGKYRRFGNVRENLIFANICEFVASRIRSSR